MIVTELGPNDHSYTPCLFHVFIPYWHSDTRHTAVQLRHPCVERSVFTWKSTCDTSGSSNAHCDRGVARKCGRVFFWGGWRGWGIERDTPATSRILWKFAAALRARHRVAPEPSQPWCGTKVWCCPPSCGEDTISPKIVVSQTQIMSEINKQSLQNSSENLGYVKFAEKVLQTYSLKL